MPTVTVIIVAYNSRELLERPLSSVLPSRGADAVDVVVVDNASSDGTASFVRERFPHVRVLEPGENLGFGRACNLAARETAGDHILLLNPDAWVDAGCVDRLRLAMTADDRLGWAAPRLFYPDGRRQFIWGPTIGVFGESVQLLRNRFAGQRWVYDALPKSMQALGNAGWYSAACGLVRRSAWEEVEGFDPGFFLYFEDADFGLRLRQAGWRLAQVAEARAFHDKHGPAGPSDRLLRYREAQFRYYRKHRPSWENRLLLSKQVRGLRAVVDEALRSRLGVTCDQARAALREGRLELAEKGVLGSAKGLVELSEDFDEPLRDFDEYR